MEDIYVLDHDTDGDAMEALSDACREYGVQHLIDVEHAHSYDSFWLSYITRAFQRFLLCSYDAVLFSAADEIVTPVSDMNLVTYMAGMGPTEIKVATGYEIVHKKDEEPPIDWSQPLIPQRKWCYQSATYSKPLLAKSPVTWGPGWFHATNVPRAQEPDPNLVLLHLHRIDYDECLRSHREKGARMWKPEERREGVFRQNLVEDPEYLSRWLLSNAADTRQWATLMEIPEEFKEFA
jgi:hypothetical protein